MQSEHSDTETKEPSKGKHTQLVDHMKEETWWVSFGRAIMELSKQLIETLPDNLKSFVPSYFRSDENHKKGLTPLKDALKMPKDEIKNNVSLKKRIITPTSETKHASFSNAHAKSDEMKPPKMKSSSSKTPPSLLNKHSHSGQQEYAEFYGSGLVSSSHSRSKGQKDRSRHRQKEKGSELLAGVLSAEPKPAEMKTDYSDAKFGQFNFRNKYRFDSSSFHFWLSWLYSREYTDGLSFLQVFYNFLTSSKKMDEHSWRIDYEETWRLSFNVFF